MNLGKLVCFGFLYCFGIQTITPLAWAAGEGQDVKRPLVIVITGESNSGGSGRNVDVSPKEKEPRPSVQIMNLTSGKFGFETMQLGVNNLRDHTGMNETHYTSWHGFENELANEVDANSFPHHEQVYLIKTGHGGSRIAQWTENSPSGFWKKFIERTEAGKRQLPDNPQWVVWFSLGINDAIAKTPIEQWEKEIRAHLKKIKAQLPGAIIIMTQFQSMGEGEAKDIYPETDATIAKIAGDDTDVYAVDSTGADLVDRNHWSYKGLKTVTQRMVKITREALDKAGK